jgi:hypothetical protein
MTMKNAVMGCGKKSSYSLGHGCLLSVELISQIHRPVVLFSASSPVVAGQVEERGVQVLDGNARLKRQAWRKKMISRIQLLVRLNLGSVQRTWRRTLKRPGGGCNSRGF